jgi:hypothetical protein
LWDMNSICKRHDTTGHRSVIGSTSISTALVGQCRQRSSGYDETGSECVCERESG